MSWNPTCGTYTEDDPVSKSGICVFDNDVEDWLESYYYGEEWDAPVLDENGVLISAGEDAEKVIETVERLGLPLKGLHIDTDYETDFSGILSKTELPYFADVEEGDYQLQPYDVTSVVLTKELAEAMGTYTPVYRSLVEKRAAQSYALYECHSPEGVYLEPFLAFVSDDEGKREEARVVLQHIIDTRAFDGLVDSLMAGEAFTIQPPEK